MIENVPELSALSRRDAAHHLHPQTNLLLHETVGANVVTRGDGCYFYEENGKRYLDMAAGLWCTAVGLNDKRLPAAAARQFEALPYMQTFNHRTTEPVVELCEMLTRLAPVPMSKVMLQTSGSEANDTAVKIVWYYWAAKGQPSRRKIIARKRAYHGTTAVAASMTDLPHMHAAFGLPLPGFLHVSCADTYRGMAAGESEEAYATRLADELEQRIIAEGPETIAAFIAEPMMGAGGLFVPPATYFEKIRAVLDRYEILLIADEVITGLGRTGNWWGSQTFNVKPDIITSAKALSSAYLPISAVMINDRVFDGIKEQSAQLGVFGHGYTYGGHPVSAAVACEAIRIYEQDGLVERSATMGARLSERLRAIAEHPLIGNIRGTGLMWGVELVKDKASKTNYADAAKVGYRVSAACLERGVSIRPLGNVLSFSPALIIEQEQLDFAVDVFESALNQIILDLRRDGFA